MLQDPGVYPDNGPRPRQDMGEHAPTGEPVDVDLLFLSRDLSAPRDDVWIGIESQRGVRFHVYRITGTPHADDPNRYETIARARNVAKELGTFPWVMLLDDDVILGPHCLAQLVEGLRRRSRFAALAADSAGEMKDGWDHWDYPRHVGMAAVLFRRERLADLTFRWEPGRCECGCCCDDLRRSGHAIGYLQGAEAWHRPIPRIEKTEAAPLNLTSPVRAAASASSTFPGQVLAAFDRRHLRLFIRRFLRSLRESGNSEIVTAVVYGLYPSEQRWLASIPGVRIFPARYDGHPAQRRLRDFQEVIAGWPAETPVAYWDAADVIFQDRIAPLWDLVCAHPHRLLAVREAVELRRSTVALEWVQSIRDAEARDCALDLLLRRPVLNAGFAAGSAQAMLRYLQAADRLLHSPTLQGSTDWGDQTALNLYCHSNPEAWVEIPTGWNYCLVGRKRIDFAVTDAGRTERLDGEPLHVVHGAGGTLRLFDLLHLTS